MSDGGNGPELLKIANAFRSRILKERDHIEAGAGYRKTSRTT